MTSPRTKRRFFLLCVISFGGLASGQSPWAEQHGTQSNERYGSAIAALDDLDGDGVVDLAVSAPGHKVGLTVKGRVTVLSGATLAQLWISDGSVTGGGHGSSLANPGDMDGDGVSDLLIGAPAWSLPVEAGRVQLVSGANGALLAQADGALPGDGFGSSVAGLSDIDGDGVRDFAVGAMLAKVGGASHGTVCFVSGVDGSSILSVPGPQVDGAFGNQVAPFDDMDGDGKQDLLVAALALDHSGMQNAGAVYLVSGLDGSTIHTWLGPDPGGRFGWALANLGDVDGDGVADVGVGGAATVSSGMPWTTEAVYVYSGASKALLFVRYGDTQTSAFDRSIAAVPDVSGDGLPDVLAGAPSFTDVGNMSGRASLYAGATGAELGRVYGEHAMGLGWSVAGLGDLDGDGRVEFAASGLDAADDYKGVLRLYSAAAVMPPSIYCTAKTNSQGCLPAIAVEGSPMLSGPDDLVLRADDVINNKVGVFLWGRSAGKLAAFDAVICIGSPLTRMGPTFTGGSAGPDDCSGLMSVPFTHDYMSQQGIVAGDDVHVQGWYRDPALPVHSAGLSNAALFFVAP